MLIASFFADWAITLRSYQHNRLPLLEEKLLLIIGLFFFFKTYFPPIKYISICKEFYCF